MLTGNGNRSPVNSGRQLGLKTDQNRERKKERNSQEVEAAEVNESVESDAADAVSVQQPTINHHVVYRQNYPSRIFHTFKAYKTKLLRQNNNHTAVTFIR